MATLFNTKIKDTYQSLLKLEDNTILTTTVKNVTDGLGNASPLYMSTTRIGIGTNAPSGVLHITSTEGMAGNNGGQIALSQAGASPAVIGIQGSGWNTFGIWGISRFTTTAVPDLRIFASGIVSVYNNSLLVGAITTSTAKFQVRGGGSSSATTALLVDNSSGTAALTVRDDGSASVSGNFNSGNLQLNSGFEVKTLFGTLRFSSASSADFTMSNISFTSETQITSLGSPGNTTKSGLNIAGNFTNNGAGSTSVGNNFNVTTQLNTAVGNVTLNNINVINTINTTGGTTLQRGFYYNPTLTGTVGFTHNAIETVTGNVLLGTTSGNVGIGTSNPTSTLTVNGNISATSLSLTGTLQSTGTGDNYLKGSAFTIQSAVNNSDNGFYISTASLLERKVLFLAKNLGSYGRSDLYLCLNGDATATNASITDSKVVFKANGNVLIGTTTDAGEKLQVNGTVRAGSTLQLDNGAITWGNATGAPTSRLRITRRTGYGVPTGIEIGALNSNTSAFASTPIVIGDLNTLADVGTLILGNSNNVQKDQSLVVGSNNSVPVVTGVTTSKQIILGDGNTANAYTNGQVPGIIVGYGNNQNGFSWSQMYGTLLKPYANGQLLFGANAGPVNPSIREVYIGYGFRNEYTSGNQDNGNANNLLISPSNASDATDKNGGNLTLAGSRGTGAGTPGNLIFSTATTTTSGTTLQTLNERMRINGSGNVLIGTTTDGGYKLDVNGTSIFRGTLGLTGGTAIQLAVTTQGNTRILSDGGNNIILNAASTTIEHSFGTYPIRKRMLTTYGDTQTNAGVAIGVDAVNVASAILSVESTTKGFLPPRMTNAERAAITSPAIGLMVYCTDSVEGLYIYKSTGWTFIA